MAQLATILISQYIIAYDPSILLTTSLIGELIRQLNGEIKMECEAEQTCIRLLIPYVASTSKVSKNKPNLTKKASSAWIKRLAEYETAPLSQQDETQEGSYKSPELNVDFLAKAMNCSRSSLHAKLKTLSGYSTVEFLTDYRLGKAQQLLMQGKSVSEAAMMVGFGDANYFSRVFKKKYQQSPKQTLKNG